MITRPEIDYGMRWTTTNPNEMWRISWQQGTGYLTATNTTTDQQFRLATFDTRQTVETALYDWAALCETPNTLTAMLIRLGPNS
jgi:hypothetical protein